MDERSRILSAVVSAAFAMFDESRIAAVGAARMIRRRRDSSLLLVESSSPSKDTDDGLSCSCAVFLAKLFVAGAKLKQQHWKKLNEIT